MNSKLVKGLGYIILLLFIIGIGIGQFKRFDFTLLMVDVVCGLSAFVGMKQFWTLLKEKEEHEVKYILNQKISNMICMLCMLFAFVGSIFFLISKINNNLLDVPSIYIVVLFIVRWNHNMVYLNNQELYFDHEWYHSKKLQLLNKKEEGNKITMEFKYKNEKLSITMRNDEANIFANELKNNRSDDHGKKTSSNRRI